MTLQEVAAEAGVSKALIHYHFREKSELVARTILWVGGAVSRRERHALDGVGAEAVLERLWALVDEEVERGDLRAMLELAHDPHPSVRDAALVASRERTDAAARTVARVFNLLSMSPRVPPEMLATVLVTFADGLSLEADVIAPQTRRAAFDVFWLGALALGE